MTDSEYSALDLYRKFEAADGCLEPDMLRLLEPANLDSVHEWLVIEDLRQSPRRPSVLEECQIRALKAFFKDIDSIDHIQKMVAQASAEGSLTLVNPLTAGTATCNASLANAGLNFLRFQCDDDPFYLIQYNHAGEALFFPLRRLLILGSNFLNPIPRMVAFLKTVFSELREYGDYLQADNRNWGGLIYGHSSPYHFFNFQHPGVVLATQQGLTPVPALLATADDMYLDVGELVYCEKTRLHDDANAMRRELLKTNRFAFRVGLHSATWRRSMDPRQLDEPIVTYALRSKNAPAIDPDAFVLWVGLTTGKRGWIEEREALLALVRRLALRHDKVLLLVDGWTATATSEKAPSLYAKDGDLAADIQADAPAGVRIISLVGQAPSTKISFANRADFFVTSHATASLYVARYCQKPGVTHTSCAARALAERQHIHWRTNMIPARIVKDLPCEPGTDPFHVSYRIDVEAFCDFVLAVISETINPAPN